MINTDVSKMGFEKGTLEFIDNVKVMFNEIAKREGTNEDFNVWMKNNIQEIESDDILIGLTDRETYLYALGTVSGVISETYM